MPEPVTQSPYTTLPELMAMVAAFVRVDMSIVPMNGSVAFSVTVALVLSPVFSMTAVSCANGKLSLLVAPPEVAAQFVADQVPPAAELQYTVFGASNVMPRQPRKSPMRVPEIGAAVPMT